MLTRTRAAVSASGTLLQCRERDPGIPHVQPFEFHPDHKFIGSREDRVGVLGAAAVGLLHRDLTGALDISAARRIVLRLGYVAGYADAVSRRDPVESPDRLEGLRDGSVSRRLEDLGRAEIIRLTHDPNSGRFYAEAMWHESFVAMQHLYHRGRTETPVCWWLVGYGTGYASASLGQEIYFRERECLAQGAPYCTVVGRDAASWGDDLETIRAEFDAGSLGPEVERLVDAADRRLPDLGRGGRVALGRGREPNRLRESAARFAASRQFVAGTASMHDVLELAARVAPLETTVLLSGETGTGKEFIVRMVHDESPRAGGQLVSINCAALTETLLESELFGHVRGAFTGAVRDKPGLFEVANDGTLFLDEVGEAAPMIQAKLLRALQEREIRRVGAERAMPVNARVVAATNRDLRAAVAAGTFRQDLYFRLAGFVITIPPLRDRREDIPLLVDDFVRRAAQRAKKEVRTVSAAAMTALMRYTWPGNVRELEHAIERAVIVTRGEIITPRDLPPDVSHNAERPMADASLDLHEHERATIARALERFGGHRQEAADALKISTVTLWRKVKQYGLVSNR